MRSLLLFIVLLCTCVPAQAQIFGRKVIKASEADIANKRIRDIAVDAQDLATGRADQLVTAAALKEALDALPARDTANYRVRVVQDSILVYSVDSAEVGRDTVRPLGGGGGGGLSEVSRATGLVGRGTDDEPLAVDLQEVASRIFAQNMATAARLEAEAEARKHADSLFAAVPPSKGRPADELPGALDSVIGTAWRAGGGIIGETVVSSLSDLKGAIAQGDTAFLLVDGFIYLPGAGENVIVPDGWKVRFTPVGLFRVDPGDTLTLPTNLDITGDRFVLRGEGRYILRGGLAHTSWFGAGHRAALVDEDYRVLSEDHTPLTHIHRKAMWSAASIGQRNPTVVISALGGQIQVGNDASSAVREAYAGPGRRYKATEAMFQLWSHHERTTGGDTKHEIYDRVEHVFERGLNVVAPNHARHGAIDVAPYRDAGWELDVDHASPYDTAGVRGDRYIDLKLASDALRYPKGTIVGIAIGASYFDQQQMTRAIVDSVVGKRLYLDRPILLDLQPHKGSTRGAVAEAFTTPALGESVQVRLTDNVGHPTTSLFSIHNELYDLVSNDGGGLYTIRNVHAANRVGVTINAGTKTGYQRTIFPMTLTPRGTNVRGLGDVTLRSRGDGIRLSNIIDVIFENFSLYIHRQAGKDGLAGNADGYRGVTMRDVYIESKSPRTEIFQYARGGEDFNAYGFTTKGITHEITEFAHDHYFYNCSFSVNEELQPQKDNYGTTGAFHVGHTTGEVYMYNTSISATGTNVIVGSQDIGTYESTSGGRFIAEGLQLHGERVRTGITVGVAGARIEANMTGHIRDLIGQAGAYPRSEDSTLVTGMARPGGSIYTRGGVSQIDLSFEGRFDRFVGGYSGAAKIDVSYTRTGSYDGSGKPTPFSQSYGTVWHRDGPEGKPHQLQANFVGSGFPVGFETEIKFPGTLGKNDFIRMQSLRAPVYNQAETFKRIEEDTVLCVGGGCGQFLPPGTVQGVSPDDLAVTEDRLAQTISATRDELLGEIDQAIQNIELPIATGGVTYTKILPTTLGWKRKFVEYSSLPVRQLYGFTVVLRHSGRDVYAAPYHPKMVLTGLEEEEIRPGYSRLSGEFYMVEPGNFSLLLHTWFSEDVQIQGGSIKLELLGEATSEEYPLEQYYYDIESTGPRKLRPQAFALQKANWSFHSSRYDGVVFGITSRDDVSPGIISYLNCNLDVDESRYVEVTVNVFDHTGAVDMSMTDLQVASGDNLTGILGSAPLVQVSEGTTFTYAVKIPEGVDKVRSIGFYYNGPGVVSGANNNRSMIEVKAVKLVDRLADLNGDTDNATVLLRDLKAARTGVKTLDYAFLPIVFHQTLNMSGTDSTNVRNLILYDTKNRVDNRGESQHYVAAGESKDMRFNRIQMYGYADEWTITLPMDTRVPYNHQATDRNSVAHRIFDPIHGPRYQIKVSGVRNGDTLRILDRKSDRIIHEEVLYGSDQMVYYQPDAVVQRYDFLIVPNDNDSGGRSPEIQLFGRVRHIYPNEFQSGFIAGGGALRWGFDHFHVEGMRGDGFQIQPGARHIRIKDVWSYGCSRMGFSVNGGDTISATNIYAHNSGRSDFDAEPFGEGWRAGRVTLKNIVVGGYNFNGVVAHNWHRLHHFYIDGVRDIGGGSGNTWAGGMRNSVIKNLYGYRFGFTGKDMYIDSISAEKITMSFGEIKGDEERLYATNVDQDSFEVLQNQYSELLSFRGDTIEPGNVYGTVQSDSNHVNRWELRVKRFSPNYQINVEGNSIATEGHILADHFEGFESGTDYASLIRTTGRGKVLSLKNDLYEDRFAAMIRGREAQPLKSSAPDVRVEYNQISSYNLPKGTYHYRVGVILEDSSEYLFPEMFDFMTDGTEGTVRVRPVDLFDQVNGRIYYEWNVYIGSEEGVYDRVVRIRKSGKYAGIDETPGFDHLGDSMRIESTNDEYLLFGYPTTPTGEVKFPVLRRLPGGAGELIRSTVAPKLIVGNGKFGLDTDGILYDFPSSGGATVTSAHGSSAPDIVVDRKGRGHFTNIQAAADSVTRAYRAGRLLPRILIMPGVYKEAIVTSSPGVQLIGLGPTPSAVRIESPSSLPSDNLIKNEYVQFRVQNIELYSNGSDPNLDFISLTGASVDSIVIQDVVMVSDGRLDLFVEATSKVYTSFVIDGLITRGATGSSDNGGITGRSGMVVINSRLEGENVLVNSKGGYFQGVFFGGKAEVDGGRFVGCTFGDPDNALYSGQISGGAFQDCSFSRSSNGTACTQIVGGSPTFTNCTFLGSYTGGGVGARPVDIIGGTPTFAGGQIIQNAAEGFAVGNSSGTLTSPKLIGTTVVGPIEEATLEIDETLIVLPGRNDMSMYPQPFTTTGQTEATYNTVRPGSDIYTIAVSLDCVQGTPTGNETIQTYRSPDGNIAIQLSNLDPDNTYRPIIIGGTSSTN